MSGPLATALIAQLGELQRWFEGRLVSEPAPTDEVVPAERYLDVDFLRAAIQDAGLSHEEARRRFWFVDKDGLLHSDRTDLSAD